MHNLLGILMFITETPFQVGDIVQLAEFIWRACGPGLDP